MSFPQPNPTLSGFPKDDDGFIRAVGKMRPVKRGGPLTVKGRPATASMSLKIIPSSHNAVSLKAAGKDHMLNDAFAANLLSREELAEALFEAKKRLIVLDSTTACLRAENQRCENDIAKQHRRIEKLLDSTSTLSNPSSSGSKMFHSSPALSNDARRELEKSLLVRQLKSQIMGLRSAVAEREIEIETLKRSHKGTKIAELLNEKEEYYLEIVRLKKAATELREALQYEQQKSAWNNKRTGAGDEVCGDAGGAMPGHRGALKGVSHPSNSKMLASKSKNIATANADRAHSKRCTRGRTSSPVAERQLFYSSSALKPLRQSTAASPSKEEDNFDAWHQSIKDYTVRDELDYFSGTSDPCTGKQFMERNDTHAHDANDNMTFELADTVMPNSSIGGEDGARVISMFVSGIQYYNHHRKEQQYKNEVNILLSFESLWSSEVSALVSGTNCTPLAFSKSNQLHSNMLWHSTLSELQMGYFNASVSTREIPSITIEIGKGRQRVPAYPTFNVLTAPAGAQTDVLLEILIFDMDGSDVGRVSVTLNMASQAAPASIVTTPHRDPVHRPCRAAAFKLGDAVEGQYVGGIDWYRATVKAVNASLNTAGSITYQVLYDDGDAEDEIEEVRVRHLTALSASAEETLQSPHTLKATYSIGDPVDALYGRGLDWYAASVTAVTMMGRYNLLYDDGDVEDDVSVTRMRALLSTAPLPTSAAIFSSSLPSASALAPQSDISMGPSGQELTIGYGDDCDTKVDSKGVSENTDSCAEFHLGLRELSMKTSEDAFFDNYLDELSDDDGPDLNTGSAVYGNLAPSSATDSAVVRTGHGHGEDRAVCAEDCKIDKEETSIHDSHNEVGYEEDFDT